MCRRTHTHTHLLTAGTKFRLKTTMTWPRRCCCSLIRWSSTRQTPTPTASLYYKQATTPAKLCLVLCKLCGWFLVCLARARARVRVCVCVCVCTLCAGVFYSAINIHAKVRSVLCADTSKQGSTLLTSKRRSPATPECASLWMCFDVSHE